MTATHINDGLRAREHVFFLTMALAVAAAVFAGFARSFYLRPRFPEVAAPAEPVFIVHGLVFTAWMLLLAVQSSLVASGRVRQHRALGVAGAGIAVAVVVLGVTGALVAAARPGGLINVPVPPLQFPVVPLLDMTLFSVCVALAVAWRQFPQTHKRLMLLATVNMLTAAFARVPLEITFNNVLACWPPSS